MVTPVLILHYTMLVRNLLYAAIGESDRMLLRFVKP